MTRASGSATRVHYEGSSCNFVIFGTSQEMVSKWKKDHSLPLAEVVDSYHVFTTRHHGNQGILDEASHSLLENEFGTHKVEECIQQILEKGEVKEQKGREREGTTNLTMGSFVAHN